MSVPALRQPKLVSRQQKLRKTNKVILPDLQYVIMTLKGEQKLVVSSDAYHGLITVGEMYKCVFCLTGMELDSTCKENHIKSVSHKKMLQKYPHVEEYGENLIRRLTKGSSFCTICNVVIANVYLMRHFHAEAHTEELEKARTQAATYKPMNGVVTGLK